MIPPRWTRARSYSAQFPTRYLVLYLGCTLDFMTRSWPIYPTERERLGPGSPQARNSCTNALLLSGVVTFGRLWPTRLAGWEGA